jgi:hypothetical protein
MEPFPHYRVQAFMAWAEKSLALPLHAMITYEGVKISFDAFLSSSPDDGVSFTL